MHEAESAGQRTETQFDWEDQNKGYFDQLERLTADEWLRSG